MMRMSTTHHNIKKQSGVSVVTAIFLIVILSLMGVGMVSLLSTSQQSISQEITSAKAYMAARSCLQWGIYQSVYPAASPPVDIEGTNTFNDSASALFNTRCDTTKTNIINADNLRFFNITTTAKFGNTLDPEYSERTLRLQFQP